MKEFRRATIKRILIVLMSMAFVSRGRSVTAEVPSTGEGSLIQPDGGYSCEISKEKDAFKIAGIHGGC